MAPLIHCDTHVVVWLAAGEVDRLPPFMGRLPAEHRVEISPIVLLEVQYLNETGKIRLPPLEMLAELGNQFGIGVSDTPFSQVVQEGLLQSWTRDPFDRIISSNANKSGAWLLTKDRMILDNPPRSFWA